MFCQLCGIRVVFCVMFCRSLFVLLCKYFDYSLIIKKFFLITATISNAWYTDGNHIKAINYREVNFALSIEVTQRNV
jgi:hypothetical protein